MQHRRSLNYLDYIRLHNFLLFMFFCFFLQETDLVKLVNKFTQLSKDYVDLQSQYEQTKEELNQEHVNPSSDLQIPQVRAYLASVFT